MKTISYKIPASLYNLWQMVCGRYRPTRAPEISVPLDTHQAFKAELRRMDVAGRDCSEIITCGNFTYASTCAQPYPHYPEMFPEINSEDT